jgi:hypothetical protein
VVHHRADLPRLAEIDGFAYVDPVVLVSQRVASPILLDASLVVPLSLLEGFDLLIGFFLRLI